MQRALPEAACPECQLAQTFNRQQGAIRYGADLPPELWIMIFRYMDKGSLLYVRSTCRRWRDIIDQNKSLREQFCVVFKVQGTMDEKFQPTNLFPSALRTEFSQGRIISVDGWWPSVGTGLTELCVWRCKITLPVLLRMLRRTPNLTSLTLGQIEFSPDEEFNADFRLDKLKYLFCEQIFDVFGNIFPRLRELHIEADLDDFEAEKVCRLINSVQETLKELDCQLTPFMVEEMANMYRLRLTKVTVCSAGCELVAQLSQTQDAIEYLTTVAICEDLCIIGRNLPKLKEMTIIMLDAETMVPSFLADLHQLRVFTLEGLEGDRLDFDRFSSATLTHLKLSTLHIAADSFQRFLSNCSSLEELDISNCQLGSWSEVFAARFQRLRRLYIYRTSVVQNIMKVSTEFGALRELNISTCNMLEEILIELLLQCPRLEKLMLCKLNAVNDEFVGNLDQFPQLKELDIRYCSITETSLVVIAEKYTHLIVKIKSFEISDAAIKLLSCGKCSG